MSLLCRKKNTKFLKSLTDYTLKKSAIEILKELCCKFIRSFALIKKYLF